MKSSVITFPGSNCDRDMSVALNKFGFNQLHKSKKYHPTKLDFYSMSFNKVCDLDLTTFNSENEKYTSLQRSTLIKFLKDNLFSNSIVFRKIIKTIKKNNERIEIYFTDGSKDDVDYLVVSDGVFSNTKSIIENKNFKPIYYGAIAIRSFVKTKNIYNLNSNNISLLMGSNAHLVMYPINQNKELNLVCLIRKKLKVNNDIKQVLENTIFKENKKLTDLFDSNLKSWPIFISDKPVKSIYKNVFYIGDAFYTFPPTMAQGASQAIESANEIFNLIISSNQNIQNVYYKKRLERINLINKRSKLNYFAFHISNSLLKIFRNKALKIITKNKNFINNYLGKVYK